MARISAACRTRRRPESVSSAARALRSSSAAPASNGALASRRRGGQSVLPLAFGEAGLPVHPRLQDELAAAASRGSYGPVAGIPALRAAVAGYWTRRGLPTEPGAVVAGPGSK